jgi:hypothetical protein
MAEYNKLDLKALKDYQENGGKTGGDYKFWKPKEEGKYTLRILPPATKGGFFFKKTAQCRIGDKYFFSPHAEGKPDPIYDYCRALWKKGTDEAKDLYRLIKPREQYIYNIIVRDENGKPTENPTKVLVFQTGKVLFTKIMDTIFDPDFGDITDVEAGYDFILNKEMIGGFANYDRSKARAKPSPLFEDDDMIQATLEGIHDLTNYIEYRTYDELKEELDRFLAERNGTASAPRTQSTAHQSSDVEPDDDEFSKFESELLDKLDS